MNIRGFRARRYAPGDGLLPRNHPGDYARRNTRIGRWAGANSTNYNFFDRSYDSHAQDNPQVITITPNRPFDILGCKLFLRWQSQLETILWDRRHSAIYSSYCARPARPPRIPSRDKKSLQYPTHHTSTPPYSITWIRSTIMYILTQETPIRHQNDPTPIGETIWTPPLVSIRGRLSIFSLTF